MSVVRSLVVLGMGAVTAVGCARTGVKQPAAATLAAAEPQVERGRPNRFVDGVGWVLGIPEKVILWDRRAENHDVSAETEQKLAEYLAVNGMTSTKVRVNQYDPGGEWRRLAANKQVGAGWRYTVGALRTLGYTVLPGRLIGNDGYNPYTDTVSIYSDIPALAMEQGGHAKNVKRRELPGTYAAFTSLPIVALFPEKAAKDDALAYIAWEGTPAEHVAAVKTLYPQYGSEIGGQAGVLVPGAQPLLALAGAGVGHVAGRYRAGGAVQPAQYVALATPTSGTLPVVAETNAASLAERAAVDGGVAQASAIDPAAAIEPAVTR